MPTDQAAETILTEAAAHAEKCLRLITSAQETPGVSR